MRLDKVHRPQVAWNVIIVAILIGVIGIIVQKIIANDGLLDGSSSPYSPEVMKYMYFASGPKMYKLYTALGIAAMLFMYLVDYTTVARHSKVIAFWLIAINYLIIYVGLDHTPICLKGHKGLIVKSYHVTIPMMFLLIPLFAGILYKYRGQSYGGLIKALLWIIIPQIKAVIPFRDNKISDLVLAVSMLVQLTVAIKKNWIKVRKLPSIISIWALYAVYVAHFAYIGYNTESFYPIDYSDVSSMEGNFRAVLDSMKMIGGGSAALWGGRLSTPTRRWVTSAESSHVLTYISVTWGVIIGLAVIAIVAALIVFGLVAMSKVKNQLGQVMGIGCMMWLAANAIANIVVGFGMVPEFYTSFFPFISNEKIIISYVFLGILISVYKYKNAYSQHVEIKSYNKSSLEEKI